MHVEMGGLDGLVAWRPRWPAPISSAWPSRTGRPSEPDQAASSASHGPADGFEPRRAANAVGRLGNRRPPEGGDVVGAPLSWLRALGTGGRPSPATAEPGEGKLCSHCGQWLSALPHD